MKKYNIALVVVFTIFIIAIFGYIYFIDKIYENKIILKEIEVLNSAYNKANKQIITQLNTKELKREKEYLITILEKISLNASLEEKNNSFIISGAIKDTADYILLKKFINVIQTTNYISDDICIGKNCYKNSFGFSLSIRPYKISIK